ncbi:hypothetical protein EVAR_20525_1 [Eumeta japonica]|uniref:Helitron helicase-like domain-containing protein n=1 Tax=Eumeta variegata TaxID=151549 RepID=A0A4C1VLV1_EUMVA|nr:hypothetical protein EVAR_20525_1 [Eumeta japonica]
MIQWFKTALEMMPSDDHKIVITAGKIPGEHERRSNAPMLNEVGIVVVGENMECRDFVIQRRNGANLQRISETHQWQKRGLPHAHILLWMVEKIRPDEIDSIICAEIPAPEVDLKLYETVKNMIHGRPGSAFDCDPGPDLNSVFRPVFNSDFVTSRSSNLDEAVGKDSLHIL